LLRIYTCSLPKAAPECFRDEADRFNQQTVRPVDCKKDVWSLACVFSEAIVWCVLGAAGLAEYRDKRRAETARLARLKRTAYSGCFHNGEELLPVVRDMHIRVRMARSTYDQIINDEIPIIEEMLSHVEKRPDALTTRSRFRAALETAQRMSYPGPFQVTPEPSPPPRLLSAHSGVIGGLGATRFPARQSYTPLDERKRIHASPASTPAL
jgi:hypothetical protein